MKLKPALTLFLICLLSLSYLTPASGSQAACRKVLDKIRWEILTQEQDPNPTRPSNYTINFMFLSGRFLNDFGQYQECQNMTLSHYLTMNFSANVLSNKVDALIGFCAPINCTDHESKLEIDLVYEIFELGMGLPFSNFTNKSSAAFYDPKKPHLGDTATTVVIVIVLLVWLSFTFIGTGAALYRRIKSNMRVKKDDEEKLLSNNADERSSINTKPSGERDNGSEVSEARPKIQLKGMAKFFDCFDARKNFDRIITIKYTDTYDFNLEIFNGIRVFMMMYVVFGHTFLFGADYIDNIVDVPNLVKSWLFLVIFGALYSVDVFFYMSGFLFAYIGLGKLKKIKPTPLNYIGLLFHRLLRFWPVYTLVLIFFWRILPLMGEGPIWFKMTQNTGLCEGQIWQNLILMDDFLVQSANYCFGWGWYLSNDFQMFMVTPFFLWLYIRKRTLGKISLVLMMIIGWGLALGIGANLKVKATPPSTGGITNSTVFAQYYVKPYIRMPPYFIGVLAGLLYKEYKDQYGLSYRIGRFISKNKIIKNLLQLTGTVVVILLVLIVRPLQMHGDSAWPLRTHVAFRAFQKSIYVVAMTMMVTPILLGEHNLLKRFLSHPLFVPFARLSFSAYLVHLFWVYRNYYNLPFSNHMTFLSGTLTTMSNIAIAFFTGLILSLVAEVPIANIESAFLTKGRGKGSRTGKVQQHLPAEDVSKEPKGAIIPISKEEQEGQ